MPSVIGSSSTTADASTSAAPSSSHVGRVSSETTAVPQAGRSCDTHYPAADNKRRCRESSLETVAETRPSVSAPPLRPTGSQQDISACKIKKPINRRPPTPARLMATTAISQDGSIAMAKWSPQNEEVRPMHGPESSRVWLFTNGNTNLLAPGQRPCRHWRSPTTTSSLPPLRPTNHGLSYKYAGADEETKSSPAQLQQFRKKSVRFKEPLETYYPEQRGSSPVPVHATPSACRCSENTHVNVNGALRAKAGMDCGRNGNGGNGSCKASGCCSPNRRSVCGSPWPSDAVEAQIAACSCCSPPCPPPCCQNRCCLCPAPSDGLLQQDYNFHRKFRAIEKCPVGAVQLIESENREKRHHSGCEHNKVCCADPCACTGPFDVEESMHHKYRGVSKDPVGQTEVNENECRQRRQYGDCPPPINC